jgi:hypothetical protein
VARRLGRAGLVARLGGCLGDRAVVGLAVRRPGSRGPAEGRVGLGLGLIDLGLVSLTVGLGLGLVVVDPVDLRLASIGQVGPGMVDLCLVSLVLA